jgi:hypothetical protein
MKHYDLLRSFLRRISYGCYARADFTALGVSGRSYDDLRRRMEVFMPEMYVKKSRHKNAQHVTLHADAYLSSDNYLIHSFRCAGFVSPMQVCCLLGILQCVQASDRPVTRGDMLNRLSLGLPDLNESTLRSYLRLLCDAGLLRRISARVTSFAAVKNPLHTLSAEDMQLLCFAVGFYRQVALIGVPGYDLTETLDRIAPPVRGFSPWVFKNAPAVRMLDDAVLLSLISAIERRETVSFCYEDSDARRTILPCALSVRTSDQRRYVIGLEGDTRLSLRVDRMSDVRPGKVFMGKEAVQEPRHKERDAKTEVTLRLRFDYPAMRRALRARIRARFPAAVFVRENVRRCSVRFSVRDPRSLAPFLRAMYPFCAVVSPRSLREHMLKDLREALGRYE